MRECETKGLVFSVLFTLIFHTAQDPESLQIPHGRVKISRLGNFFCFVDLLPSALNRL